MGKGGFGITYLALDTKLGKYYALKELLPDSIATRIDGTTVVPQSSGQHENWQWAKERFIDEAASLCLLWQKKGNGSLTGVMEKEHYFGIITM